MVTMNQSDTAERDKDALKLAKESIQEVEVKLEHLVDRLERSGEEATSDYAQALRRSQSLLDELAKLIVSR